MWSTWEVTKQQHKPQREQPVGWQHHPLTRNHRWNKISRSVSPAPLWTKLRDNDMSWEKPGWAVAASRAWKQKQAIQSRLAAPLMWPQQLTNSVGQRLTHLDRRNRKWPRFCFMHRLTTVDQRLSEGTAQEPLGWHVKISSRIKK